ncbi:MAG: Rne/Rng family ribonuclease [Proteobacteria bacterium]|jgi:ribonuclease E|nr:Rne/Rng family ribonuclease [Pseudomonadota bacterium]
MTNNCIIIDSAHREETRIAVVDQNSKLLDFDRSAYSIKQIKGNIYLAKVMRVEQSLQACFVDYGSDRHGFLPFSDIHPKYFQVSDAEKQKILDSTVPQNTRQDDEEETNSYSSQQKDEQESFAIGSYSLEEETAEHKDNNKSNIYNIYKKYQLQDVIKTGQLVLVQAVKEERGNKGASMTTYISIAGKYCVLMANTPNKGGVSKKIDNFRDRKILKAILNDINLPIDRSLIIRTAGVGKKPEDIKRDCEYLNRLWQNIQDSASSSTAPSFIHAEDDIIRRCIRDIYNEQIAEVVVEGEEAYQTVLDFAKLTMPNNKHNINLHNDRLPIFNKYRIEQQISALYEKKIALPSGGSLVIDNTEALVAIDINSGKSTKESGIEETAYNTNLEAVKEIAKQLRLRDLAGLIVIDFIDMEDQRNRRNIERSLRDELQNDRARIQMGRISSFGLLEMSRQRLGSSFFETITTPCQHCGGTGFVRSVEILVVSILRAIRHACADKQAGVIYVYTDAKTISHIINYKKNEIDLTEKNYNIYIFFHPSEENGVNGFNIKKRKNLSEEEKREFDMKIATGKVNQLNIEQSYLQDFDTNEQNCEPDFEQEPQQQQQHRYQKNRHDRYDRKKKKHYQQKNSKPSSIKNFLNFFFKNR